MRTSRTLLRPHCEADAADVARFADDPEWARYLPVPSPYGLADAKAFVAAQLGLDAIQHPSWAVEVDEAVVGGINCRFFFEHQLGEIGYSIARSRWGQGLATEVATAIIQQAFTVHRDLQRIRAMADSRNVASLRVLQKLGMTREGVLRRNRVVRGAGIDEVWFGVLRDEWAGRPLVSVEEVNKHDY